MPRKRHTADEIVAKLRQVDVLIGQGRPVAEAVRAIGVSEVTYYRWRSEYGGFLMTYPPGRMFHVFEDPYFDEAETKAERLLYAAIDYCNERSIVYVAAKPPRPKLVTLARRTGKQIVYLPIGQLSPSTLRKIRVFHVLDGRAVRSYAAGYIGS